MKSIKIFLSLVTLVLISCSSDVTINYPDNFPDGDNNCLPGLGSIVTEEREVSNFHSVFSSIPADIFITQGPQEAIAIEAQPNILGEIRTTVINGELRISLNRCINTTQAVKVYITIPEIQDLSLAGAGDIIGQNEWEVTDLKLVLTGVGNFEIQGTTNTLDILMTGVGDIRAFDLISDSCVVEMTGVGNIEVYANVDLDITIIGNGIVYYKGTPAISSSITGMGSVVDAN